MTTRLSARLPVFRSLAAATVAGVAVLAASQPLADDGQPAASVYHRRTDGTATLPAQSPASATADAAAAAAQAERIVASSLQVFARAGSVSLKLRQKARVGDRVLVGTGRYLQSGQGEDQRFRFDSTLKCDTETFEFTEVSDGLFCWTHRHNGEEAPTLQRVDIRRVREKLASLKAPDAADGAAYLGGLQRTLRLLRHWFRFTQAVPGDLDGLPVWIVDGSWNPEYLALVLPDIKPLQARPEGIGPADLPDGMPWTIRLTIGKSDLVPHRIEWLAIPGPRPVAAVPVEPVAVMDLHDIELDVPVDATAFFYQPATEGLIDVTEMYVATLGLMR